MTSTTHLRPLFVAASAAALANIAVGIVAAPVKAVALGAQPVHLGLMGGLGAASYLLATVPSGRLADRYGPFRLAWYGSWVMAVGMFLWALAPSLWWVIALVSINAVGQGMFWPALEAWIAEHAVPGKLGKTMGSFNLSWSAGGAIGALLAGILCKLMGSTLVIGSAGVLLLFAGALTWRFRGWLVDQPTGELAPKAESVEAQPVALPPGANPSLMLVMGRMSNFALYFVLLAAFTLFPRFTANQGLSPVELSFIIFAGRFGLWPGFLVLRNNTRWHFNLGFARIVLLLGSACAVLIWLFSRNFSSIWPLVGVTFVLGLACSASYSESLLYSWMAPSSGKGRASGMHEMILGSSAFFAPLAAGGLAQATNIPLALLMSAALPLVVLIWFEIAYRRSLCFART